MTTTAGDVESTKAPWWTGFPPTTVHVDCGGAKHRVTWRRGKLVLEDHDLTAERALVALGGKPCTCVEVLEVWRASLDNRSGLDALRDGDDDTVEGIMGRLTFAEAVMRQEEQVGRLLPRLRLGPQAGGNLLRLVARGGTLRRALPFDLRFRLALAVVMRCSREWPARDVVMSVGHEVGALLEQKAARAVIDGMRSWRGRLAAHARVDVECHPAGERESPAVTGRAEAGGAAVSVCLPIRWLVDVWARGVEVVDGCFVVSVDGVYADGRVLDVRATRWERAEIAASVPVVSPAVLVRDEEGQWHLRWREPSAAAGTGA